MEFGKIKDLKIGDLVDIPWTEGRWKNIYQEIPPKGYNYFPVIKLFPNSANVQCEGSVLTIDENIWPFIIKTRKNITQEKPIIKLPFNYSINKHCWNAALEKDMIEKACTSASSTLRRTLREWPYNHILVHEVKKEIDEIHFFLKKDSAATRQF